MADDLQYAFLPESELEKAITPDWLRIRTGSVPGYPARPGAQFPGLPQVAQPSSSPMATASAQPDAAQPEQPTAPAAPTAATGMGRSPYEQEMIKGISEMRQEAKSPLGLQETKDLPQEKPKPPISPKDYMTFVGMAMAFSLMAGKASKNHTAAALNTFSSAVRGHMEGEKIKADEAAKEFKRQMDNAVRENQKIVEKNRQILENRKMSLEERSRELEYLAKLNRDWTTAENARARRLDAIDRDLRMKEQANQKMRQAAASAERWIAQMPEKQRAQARAQIQADLSAAGAAQPGATPSPAATAAPAKTVVRTGVSNGRKVIQYSDGSVEYAD